MSRYLKLGADNGGGGSKMECIDHASGRDGWEISDGGGDGGKDPRELRQ